MSANQYVNELEQVIKINIDKSINSATKQLNDIVDAIKNKLITDVREDMINNVLRNIGNSKLFVSEYGKINIDEIIESIDKDIKSDLYDRKDNSICRVAYTPSYSCGVSDVIPIFFNELKTKSWLDSNVRKLYISALKEIEKCILLDNDYMIHTQYYMVLPICGIDHKYTSSYPPIYCSNFKIRTIQMYVYTAKGQLYTTELNVENMQVKITYKINVKANIKLNKICIDIIKSFGVKFEQSHTKIYDMLIESTLKYWGDKDFGNYSLKFEEIYDELQQSKQIIQTLKNETEIKTKETSN